MTGCAYVDQDEKEIQSALLTGIRCKTAMYRIEKKERRTLNVIFMRSKANKSLAVSHRSSLIIRADKTGERITLMVADQDKERNRGQ
jgi:hypothetical protein